MSEPMPYELYVDCCVLVFLALLVCLYVAWKLSDLDATIRSCYRHDTDRAERLRVNAQRRDAKAGGEEQDRPGEGQERD